MLLGLHCIKKYKIVLYKIEFINMTGIDDFPIMFNVGSLRPNMLHFPRFYSNLCQLLRSVGHDQCKLSLTCERFPICDDKVPENGRCVIKIIGIHYYSMNLCIYSVMSQSKHKHLNEGKM